MVLAFSVLHRAFPRHLGKVNDDVTFGCGHWAVGGASEPGPWGRRQVSPASSKEPGLRPAPAFSPWVSGFRGNQQLHVKSQVLLLTCTLWEHDQPLRLLKILSGLTVLHQGLASSPGPSPHVRGEAGECGRGIAQQFCGRRQEANGDVFRRTSDSLARCALRCSQV